MHAQGACAAWISLCGCPCHRLPPRSSAACRADVHAVRARPCPHGIRSLVATLCHLQRGELVGPWGLQAQLLHFRDCVRSRAGGSASRRGSGACKGRTQPAPPPSHRDAGGGCATTDGSPNAHHTPPHWSSRAVQRPPTHSLSLHACTPCAPIGSRALHSDIASGAGSGARGQRQVATLAQAAARPTRTAQNAEALT